MDNISRNMLHRTEMVLGKATVAGIGRIRVIIFGIGGVGSWCAESLVRSGVHHLTIVDSDIICATNINRQLEATSQNVGKVKTEEMRKRLLEINPQADIVAIQRAFDPQTAESFSLADYDYVIDAIDSLRNKILLLETCEAVGTKVFSSMGAAAKVDPTKIRIGKMSETTVCPLAFELRHALRRKQASLDFLCVYSVEVNREPQTPSFCGTGECTCTVDRASFNGQNGGSSPDCCAKKRRINGSLSHITAVFGFMLAGLVVQDQLSYQLNGPVEPARGEGETP